MNLSHKSPLGMTEVLEGMLLLSTEDRMKKMAIGIKKF